MNLAIIIPPPSTRDTCGTTLSESNGKLLPATIISCCICSWPGGRRTIDYGRPPDITTPGWNRHIRGSFVASAPHHMFLAIGLLLAQYNLQMLLTTRCWLSAAGQHANNRRYVRSGLIMAIIYATNISVFTFLLLLIYSTWRSFPPPTTPLTPNSL